MYLLRIQVVVFRVVARCASYVDTVVTDEHITSIFRAGVEKDRLHRERWAV
jgi:hypothetical protein